ncbi:unnamed protein product [Acanthoscelides obtectus]|uniref:Uncharacterized protein n=1 Tax=Acanthoscelides obtectus TaxID=200917 RepID=A0A9P0PH02_ACAOB|nr:unnamed protein product [Acanthoscelides obtectus]CAK1681882.1 hypothetical protein AOBTE_LOCUS33319 [Acanthoscelides obtectus]
MNCRCAEVQKLSTEVDDIISKIKATSVDVYCLRQDAEKFKKELTSIIVACRHETAVHPRHNLRLKHGSVIPFSVYVKI